MPGPALAHSGCDGSLPLNFHYLLKGYIKMQFMPPVISQMEQSGRENPFYPLPPSSAEGETLISRKRWLNQED